MRTISLWQPWAQAIALGLKTVETRHWPTNVRGRIAIHAAKRNTPDVRHAFDRAVGQFGFGLAFAAGGFTDFEDLPLGAVVATADLFVCVPMDGNMDVAVLPDSEKAWGNYGPGRFAWFLRDVQPLAVPIPYVGRQGFFECPLPLSGPNPS